jgi:hypothetical protein
MRLAGIFNIDWFSFTADFDDFDAEENHHLARLFKMLDEQRDSKGVEDELGTVDLGLFTFQVYPHGSKTHYYILHNEDLQLKLGRFRSKNKDAYPVYVHFKSQFLWAEIFGVKTLQDKFQLILDWLEDLLNGKYLGSKINRIDLCYHCDDVPLGFNAEYFVGKHTLDTTRRTHRVISGVDIGSRKTQKLFLRCYNKYLEARATKKAWFQDIWFHAGLNIRKVWNIEFEIHREFFTERDTTKGERRFGGKEIDTAEDVLGVLPSLWWYLTNEWVSYRVPDNERRTRWSMHPWWEQLMKYHECKDKISRGKQLELPTIEALMPAIRGYLTTYQARKGGSKSGLAMMQLWNDLTEYEKLKDKNFDETVTKKRNLLNPGQEKETP